MSSAPTVHLRPELDPLAPGIGIVSPFDLALDRELWRWTPDPVVLYITRTAHMDEPVGIAMAEALNDYDAVTAACREVAVAKPAVTAYLCTSGSFVHGVSGEALGGGFARVLAEKCSRYPQAGRTSGRVVSGRR